MPRGRLQRALRRDGQHGGARPLVRVPRDRGLPRDAGGHGGGGAVRTAPQDGVLHAERRVDAGEQPVLLPRDGGVPAHALRRDDGGAAAAVLQGLLQPRDGRDRDALRRVRLSGDGRVAGDAPRRVGGARMCGGRHDDGDVRAGRDARGVQGLRLRARRRGGGGGRLPELSVHDRLRAEAVPWQQRVVRHHGLLLRLLERRGGPEGVQDRDGGRDGLRAVRRGRDEHLLRRDGPLLHGHVAQQLQVSRGRTLAGDRS